MLIRLSIASVIPTRRQPYGKGSYWLTIVRRILLESPFAEVLKIPYRWRNNPRPHQQHQYTSNAASQVVAPTVNVPTLEKAIEELTIGAVNPGSHQILVGSRSIREGDLVVLESGGQQFSVWVQSVGMSGVLFCDTDLQKHILKPFGFGPKELPKNSVWETSDLRNLLDSDAKH